MQKYKDMSKAQQKVVKWCVVILVIIILGIVWDQARAGGCCKPNINNTYNTENTYNYNNKRIYNTYEGEGISAGDFAEGLAATAAHGGHQFDFAVKNDWQGSIVGGWVDGDHDENAVSFAVGKRFEKVDGAMFHGAFTQINSDNRLFTIGSTFRF